MRRTLLDIVDTLISPELLPLGAEGEPAQATESAIGPYELHDFFLFTSSATARRRRRSFSSPDTPHFNRDLHRRTNCAAGCRCSPPVLRQSIQAFLSARRPEGRLDQPVAARRLAHAQRRSSSTLAGVGC